MAELPLGAILSLTTWQNRNWGMFKSYRVWKWPWEENSDPKEWMSKGSCVVTWRWMSVPNFKPWYSHIHLTAISLLQVELSACQNQLKQESAARARAEAQVLEVLSGFNRNLLKLNKQLLYWSHCACGTNIPGEVYVHTFLLAEVAFVYLFKTVWWSFNFLQLHAAVILAPIRVLL